MTVHADSPTFKAMHRLSLTIKVRASVFPDNSSKLAWKRNEKAREPRHAAHPRLIRHACGSPRPRPKGPKGRRLICIV